MAMFGFISGPWDIANLSPEWTRYVESLVGTRARHTSQPTTSALRVSHFYSPVWCVADRGARSWVDLARLSPW